MREWRCRATLALETTAMVLMTAVFGYFVESPRQGRTGLSQEAATSGIKTRRNYDCDKVKEGHERHQGLKLVLFFWIWLFSGKLT